MQSFERGQPNPRNQPANLNQIMSNTLYGNQLSATERSKALGRFVYRWTHENAQQTYGGKCPACEQSSRRYGNGSMTRTQWHAYHAPLISDAEWLESTAFTVTKTGELDERVASCFHHTSYKSAILTP